MPDHSTYTEFASSVPDLSGPVKALPDVLNIQDLFQIIFRRLHQLYALDCAVLVLYDEEISRICGSCLCCSTGDGEVFNTECRPGAAFSDTTRSVAAMEFPVLKTSDEWLLEAGVNHCLPNGDASFGFHCYVPLESENHIIGTMELHNRSEPLTTACLSYCSNLTDILADSILKAKAFPIAEQIKAVGPDTENSDMLQALNNACATIAQQLEEISNYKRQLEDDQLCIPEQAGENSSYPEIIGQGPSMQRVFRLMGQVTTTDTTVLLLGETGSGKEVIARAIHHHSARKNKVMIRVNCAAIPANLIESELFGHEKGSFTGATERRLGKFELAHQGTIFLDEIGELPLDLQVRLLRVLQEREIERVGGKSVVHVDVRVISATNRNLMEEVEAGRFRMDLFYRLNVFPIALPALRYRKEDIPLLAAHFLSHFNYKTAKAIEGFSHRAMQAMLRYDWPGNVRELQHMIERQQLLSQGKVIREMDIPDTGEPGVIQQPGAKRVKTIFENERDHIYEVLQLCKGKVSGKDGAARLLGVPSTTLSSKIKKLALSKKHLL